MFEAICECGVTMRANSEQKFVELVIVHMQHSHPELSEGLTTEDVLVWWRNAFAPIDPSIDGELKTEQRDNVVPIWSGRRRTESELTPAVTFAVIKGITPLGQSERRIIEVLIAWGMAYDDIEGLEALDEQVLGLLIKARDEQALPDQGI